MIHDMPPPRAPRGPVGPQPAANFAPERPVRTVVLAPGDAPLPTDRMENRYVMPRYAVNPIIVQERVRDVDFMGRAVVSIPENRVLAAIDNDLNYTEGGNLAGLQVRNPDAAIIIPRLALADRNFQMAGNMLRQANMANPARLAEMLRLYATGGIDALMGAIYGADAIWRAGWAQFFHVFGL